MAATAFQLAVAGLDELELLMHRAVARTGARGAMLLLAARAKTRLDEDRRDMVGVANKRRGSLVWWMMWEMKANFFRPRASQG